MKPPVHCLVEYDSAQSRFIGRIVGFPHLEHLGSSVGDVEVKMRATVAGLVRSNSLVMETTFAGLLVIDDHCH